MNGDEIFKKGFGPLLPNAREVPFDDLAALEEALERNATSPLFSSSRSRARASTFPRTIISRARQALCRKYGTLFVADEIQTGIGRTGKFFAIDHYSGVEPDMVVVAKALSGGHVPVGAVLTRKWMFDKVFDRMDRAVVHGSTFSKNDLAMAAGVATLDVLKNERVIENAAEDGRAPARLVPRMAAGYELVADVRGKGLMIGDRIRPAEVVQTEGRLEPAGDRQFRPVLPAHLASRCFAITKC